MDRQTGRQTKAHTGKYSDRQIQTDRQIVGERERERERQREGERERERARKGGNFSFT